MSSDCRDRNLGIYNGIEQSSGPLQPNHHGHCDIKLIVNLLPSEYTVVDITEDILICQCDSGFESNGKVVMKSIVFRNNHTFHVFVGEQILDLSEVDIPNRYVLSTVGITDVCKKVSRLELCQGVAMRTDVAYITSHKFTLEHWKDIKSDKRTTVQLRSIKCNKVKPFSSISDKCSKCKYIWASKNIPNSESIKNASTNVLLSLLPTDVESNTPENGLIEERLSNDSLRRPNKKLPAVVTMKVDVDNDNNCVQTESISICENQPTSTLSDTLPVLKPTISETLPLPASCYTETKSTTEDAISGFSLSIQPLEMTQCVNGSRKSKKRPFPVNFVAVNRTPNSPDTVGDLVATLVKRSFEITTSQSPVTVKQEPEEGGDHINIMDHCETRSTCSYQRLYPDQRKERNSSITTSQLPVTVKQEPGQVRASYMNDYHETQPTTSNQSLNPEQSKGNPPEETATCQSSVIIKQEEDMEKTDYPDTQSTSSNHSTYSVKPNQVYMSTPESDEETSMAMSPSNIDSFVKNENHIPNLHTVDVILQESNEKDENARYGRLSTNDDIENLRKASASNKRKRSNEWGMNLWDSWRKWRNDRSSKNSLQEITPYVFVPALTVDLTAHELNYWLCRFIIEVRRHDGNDYPVDSLRQLCVSIWRYLRDTFRRYDLNMFDRKLVDFVEARECLHSRMKSLEITAKPKRKIEPISISEEDLLWKKCFDKNTATNLQFAVYFYNCKLFGIRAAEEHVCLSVDQFEVASDSTGEFMWFRGKNSKIVQGRVFDNKGYQKTKTKQYADASNPRCVVALFKKYLNYIPKDGYFYRRPLAKPNQDGTPRYSEQKVGVHAIQRYMERMCSEAGITGYKTAHSGKFIQLKNHWEPEVYWKYGGIFNDLSCCECFHCVCICYGYDTIRTTSGFENLIPAGDVTLLAEPAVRTDIDCGRRCKRYNGLCLSYFFVTSTPPICQLQSVVWNTTLSLIYMDGAQYYTEQRDYFPFSCPVSTRYTSVTLSDGTVFTYKFFTTYLTHVGAHAHCKFEGARLAQVTTRAKLDMLYTIRTTCPAVAHSAWIDGNNIGATNYNDPNQWIAPSTNASDYEDITL